MKELVNNGKLKLPTEEQQKIIKHNFYAKLRVNHKGLGQNLANQRKGIQSDWTPFFRLYNFQKYTLLMV